MGISISRSCRFKAFCLCRSGRWAPHRQWLVLNHGCPLRWLVLTRWAPHPSWRVWRGVGAPRVPGRRRCSLLNDDSGGSSCPSLLKRRQLIGIQPVGIAAEQQVLGRRNTFFADAQASNDGSISAGDMTQLLATTLPNTVSISEATEFINRWNLTVQYWGQGIYTAAEVPVGQSTDFLDVSRPPDRI